MAAAVVWADSTDVWQNEEIFVEPSEQRYFDENHWAKVVDGLEYAETIEKPKEKKKKEKKEEKWDMNDEFGASFFKVFVILTGIILVAVILYYLIKSSQLFQPKSKKIEGLKKDFDLEEVEENLEAADVDSILEQAIRAKEYTLAIRLYYLNCIKKMSANELIKWKRDKTNRTYMNELGTHELANSFREITTVFERVWYGDKIVNEQDFNTLQPKFQSFINNIKPANVG